MNLINKKVTHKSFGIGSIVKHNDSSIEINFETENKMFVYPDVFGKYLTIHDKNDAKSLEIIIQEKEMERKEEETKKEEEKKRLRQKNELRLEHEKLMKNHKLHPESQMVFWCDTEEQKNITEWQVFSGVIKSGNNKGKPNKPIRLHQNSAILLTSVDSNATEKDRRILGVYMVNEDFVGKLCVDGYIPSHSKYKIELTEEEANQLPFWKYYIDAKSPEKVTWNTGKYRYFNNLWMAQILFDIVALKNDPQEKELAQQFFKHFCKMNQITAQELPEPNGVLTRN